MTLTRNQNLVLEALKDSDKPQSAYALLDKLRPHGLKAPPQVYRALDHLLDQGLVHKLESQNAFMVCNHSGCGAHSIVVFAICEKCGDVRECDVPDIGTVVKRWTSQQYFESHKSVLEIHGLCQMCQEPQTVRPQG